MCGHTKMSFVLDSLLFFVKDAESNTPLNEGIF